MLKNATCFVVLAPFLVLLAGGAIVVAVALFFVHRIADVFDHPGDEWSA